MGERTPITGEGGIKRSCMLLYCSAYGCTGCCPYWEFAKYSRMACLTSFYFGLYWILDFYGFSLFIMGSLQCDKYPEFPNKSPIITINRD